MIWAIIPTWIKRALAGAVALVAALVGAWWSGKRSGAVRAENKGLRADAKAYEVRNEVDNRIAADADIKQRMRERWYRQR